MADPSSRGELAVSEAPIFIVGCPRSGTTLLIRILNAHPRLAIPYESHFIPSLYRQWGDPRTDAEAVALATRILRLYWTRQWKLDLKAESFAPQRSYAGVVDQLFSAFAEREGKARWGDKTPHNVREIGTLMRIFPGCRIVHIIRDGRDVALSWLRTRMEPGNMYMAASYWRQWVAEGREAGARLPANAYLEVRYESLVTRPQEVMVGVCEFIGEAFDPAMLRLRAIRRSPRWPTIGSLGRLPGISASSVGGWRKALDARERALFESVAGPLLAELGYEVEQNARKISRLERAFWRSHHSILWATRRLNPRDFLLRLETFISLRG